MEIDEVMLTPIPSIKWDFSNYLVDTVNGRVYNKSKGEFITANPNDNDYVYVGLRDEKTGEYKSFGVHRVVMSSYTGINLEMFKRGGIEVDHINDDPSLNGIAGLNMTDRRGQYRESTRERMRKPRPRLKESDVCEILEQLQEWKQNEDNKISDFIKMMCEAYDRPYRGMWNLVNKRSWKHLHE